MVWACVYSDACLVSGHDDGGDGKSGINDQGDVLRGKGAKEEMVVKHVGTGAEEAPAQLKRNGGKAAAFERSR